VHVCEREGANKEGIVQKECSKNRFNSRRVVKGERRLQVLIHCR
jgi:hypothetical protein